MGGHHVQVVILFPLPVDEPGMRDAGTVSSQYGMEKTGGASVVGAEVIIQSERRADLTRPVEPELTRGAGHPPVDCLQAVNRPP